AGVPGMALGTEGEARREAFVAQIRELRQQRLSAAAELVHAAVTREREHRRRGEPLDLDTGLVQRTRRRGAATGREERELDEARLLDATARSERLGGRRVGALEQHGDVVVGKDAAHRRLLRVVRVARDEEVRDGEALGA